MNKKKLLALLMALVMTLSLMPMTVIAEELGTVTPIAEPAEAVAVESVSFEAMNTVAEGSVAQVGDTYFTTLAEAIETAQDGDTIVILADCESNTGFIINKNLNIDTNGKTITFPENGASSNTSYRAFKITEGTLRVYGGGTIDVKGSKVPGATKSEAASGTGYYGAFRAEKGTTLDLDDLTLKNYRPWGLNVKLLGATATLDHVNIISEYGGGIEVTDDEGGEKVHEATGLATLTNCTMSQSAWFDWCSVPVSVSGNSVVNVYSTSYTGEYGAYVFSSGGTINIYGGVWTALNGHNVLMTTYDANVGYDAVINVSGGSFTGGFGINNSGHEILSITGGVFDNDPTAYVAPGYKAVENGNDTWTVQPEAAPVAQVVGGNSYETLQAAIDAAQSGDTVKLLADVSATSQIEVSKELTLDLNNYSITYTGENELTSGVIMVHRGGDLTICDNSNSAAGAVLSGDNAYAAVALTHKDDNESDGAAKLTVNNGHLTGHYYGIVGNGSRHNTVITVSGGTITGTTGSAIYHPQNGTLTVTGGDLTGEETAIEIRAGVLNISGGTYTATASPTNIQGNGSGTTTEGTAIAVAQHTTKLPITVNITDGTFNGYVPFYESNPQNNSEDDLDKVSIAISGGTFNAGSSAVYSEDKTGFITGGTFSAKPAAGYIAADHEAVALSGAQAGWYQVVPVSSVVAKIDNEKYATLAAAIGAVQNNETITLLQDVTSGLLINNGKTLTLDLAGKTLTGTVNLRSGFLTVKDNSGTQEGKLAGSVYVYGGTSSQTPYNSFTLDSTATIDAHYGIIPWPSTTDNHSCYGSTITINGRVLGNVFVSGNITEGNSVINVNGTVDATNKSDVGIALNGLATVNIGQNAVVKSRNNDFGTGIEVRAGTLNVNGGQIMGYGAPTSAEANNSGTTSKGAGIAISSYEISDINVNISGGTISGYSPLYLVNTAGTTAHDLTIAVSGGNFKLTDGGTVAVVKDINKPENRAVKFITGGKFSAKPDDSYIADGYEAVSITNEEPYTHQVGKVKATELDKQAGATETSATYQAKKSVVDPKTEATIGNSTATTYTVNVQTIEVQTAPDSIDAAKEPASLNNIKVDEVVSAAVDKADEKSVTKADVVVQLAKSEGDTTEDGKIVYEVHPEAIITVKNESDVTVGESTVALTNDQITGSFSFKLYVPIDVAVKGSTVTVTHIHDDEEEALGIFTVAEDQTVTIKGITEFSYFGVSATAAIETDTDGDYFEYMGASLRRRVMRNSTDTVVNTSTDIRFTFKIKSNSSLKYYFQWKLSSGSEWSNAVEVTDFSGDYASLVITNVPKAYFSEGIDTRIYVEVNNTVYTMDNTSYGNSVNAVATALRDGNNVPYKWQEYGKYLLEERDSYSISDVDSHI